MERISTISFGQRIPSQDRWTLGKDIHCEAREFPAKADGLWDAFRTILKHEKLRFKITLEDKGERSISLTSMSIGA